MITPQTFAVFFLILVFTLNAQTPHEPTELKNLRQSWQRATQQLTGPLDKKYLDSLQALKIRYTKDGKLAEALAVDEELKKFGTTTEAKSATLDALLGTWSWNSADKTDQSSIQFEKGGVGNHGGRGNVTWKVNENGEITIMHPSKGKAVIILSPDAKSFSGNGYDRKPVTGTRIN